MKNRIRVIEMNTFAAMPQSALKYEVDVQEDGRVVFRVPFQPGAKVVVFVIGEAQDSFPDLVSAAQSSIDFWENPLDDEDWNDA